MMKRAVHVSLFAVGTALVVACGAAPGDQTGSQGEAFSFGQIPPLPVTQMAPTTPPAPTFPPPPPLTYCPSVEPTCYFNPNWEGDADPGWSDEKAVLASLGCSTTLMRYSDSHVSAGLIVVCYDSPALEQHFNGPIHLGCDACLPQLPAGEVYEIVEGAIHGDCPSSCPTQSGTTTHSTSGTGRTAQK